MVEETRTSNRNLILLLAVGALVFALLVIGAVIFFVLRGESGEGAVTAASAEMMPADTLMYMSFNPHLDQAKHFDVIDKAWGNNPEIKKALGEMLDSLKKEGMDYKLDIEPWLGDEIAFGLGPNFLTAMTELSDAVEDTFAQIEKELSGESVPPPTSAPTEVPEVIIAVATKDQAASDRFLDKLRAKGEESGEVFEETEYKGIKIVYQEPDMAYATVDDYVVLVSGGVEAMQKVIDARDGANLADNQNYQDVLARLPADQIGYGYVDMGAYMDATVEMLSSDLAGLPPELFDPEQLKAFKGMGFSTGFAENGVRVDFAVTYDQDALPESVLTASASPNKTAGRVPADTLLYISGTGLGNGVQMLLDTMRAMPDAPEDLDESLQMLTSVLGVSVDELVEMLSGEFALAITYDVAGLAGDPSIPVGVSALLEAKDEDKFARLINSVTALAAMGGELELDETTINDVEVTVIPNPETGEMVVGVGVGEGFFAIGTSQELLESAFGAGNSSLADDARYKAAIAPLPKTNSGIFYVNVGGLGDMVGEAMSPWERESFDKARPLFDPIKAISAASEPYSKDKGSASGTFFILIESE